MVTDLGEVPEAARERHQADNHVAHDFREATLRTVMAAPDDAEYLVDGRVRWQRTVKDGKLALQPLRNVVSSTTGLDHGRKELSKGRTG